MEGNILYIDELRKDKSTYKLWLETLNSQKHFISVDLYYSGIIFFRPKQAKQHFRIRI